MLNHMNFSSHDTARRCRLDSFLSVRASTVASPTVFSRHLFYRCLIGSISRHAFNLCLANAFLSVHATLCLLNCCQAAFASSTVISPLLPHHPLSARCCLITRCQTSVVLHPLSALCWHSPVVGQWGGMGSLPSVSHSRRTNGREAEMSLSSWRWIWSDQDLSNQDGNEDANNN